MKVLPRGKFLLSTSDPDISAEDVALGYKNLLEAERSFRDLKGILRLRPVFHRLEERIRAHILICWLALLLVRLASARPATPGATSAASSSASTSSPSPAPPARSSRPPGSPPSSATSSPELQIEPPPRLTSLTPA